MPRCHREFSNLKSLVTHVSKDQHRGSNGYPLCSVRELQQQHFAQHFDPALSYPPLGRESKKQFKTLKSLEGLVAMLHFGKPKFSCSICETTFSYKRPIREYGASTRRHTTRIERNKVIRIAERRSTTLSTTNETTARAGKECICHARTPIASELSR